MSRSSSSAWVRDARIVCAFDLRTSLRSARGLLFSAFYLLTSVWVLSILVRNRESIESLIQGNDAAKHMLTAVLGWLLDNQDAFARSIANHPPLAVLYAQFALIVVPLFAMLGAYDQTATDLATRHVRFLLPKTHRAAIYVGRFAGAFLLVAVPPMFLMIAWAAFEGDVLFGLTMAVGLALYTSTFVSLMAMLSAATGRPGISALIVVTYQPAVWLVANLLGFLIDPRLKQLEWLFPSAVKPWVSDAGTSQFLIGLALCAAYSVLFFGAGWLVFRRRDT